MTALYGNLSAPEKLAAGAMRIIPLGGLGEVGRNMTVLEVGDRLLLVDCGVLFPEETQPGVDLILPDFRPIQDRLDQVVGLVLTHGHEDHIGAVPYLLKHRPDIPIYGSELTLAFLQPKLDEHGLSSAGLRQVREGERIQLEPFDLEFVSVTHSIPDSLAVFVRSEPGNVLITGDFKMDQLPLDRRLTDLPAFARFGEEGVDLFLVDSTNAEVPGFVTSESELGPVIESVVASTAGAVVVAAFSSHVHRVQQVVQAAAVTGRKVALVGRSMERNMRIAVERGFLEDPQGVFAPIHEVANLPRHQQVYMVTGSQGEPMAALGRIAQGTHSQVEVGPQDTVIFASSLIPGNENSVFRVINDLTKLGARVVHQGNAKVHVSGHAAAGELIYCYNIVKPRNVMPVHGEIRHLVANGQLAVKTGVDPQGVMLAEDGVCVDLVNHQARISGQVPCELVFVDGRSVGEIGESELEARRILGEEGFIAIFAVVKRETGEVICPPVLRAVGLAEDDSVFEPLLPQLAEVLREKAAPGNVPTLNLQQALRRVVGGFAGRTLRRRPMILPIVVEQ